jgi:hypothetical protein
MLKSPLDIPCRSCGAPAGQHCVWYINKLRLGTFFPGYHSTRKYDDFPVAVAAEKALLGDA